MPIFIKNIQFAMKSSRICFIISFSIIVLGSFTSCKSNQEDKPPNILFLIADDWSFPHASIYGDPVVKTPNFDRLAREGALFTNAYVASPSCSPSRASILTGRYPHQLESAGNLWSVIPKKFPNYVSLLEGNGYFTGKSRKGWSPGNFEKGGYAHNPAGKDYKTFKGFIDSLPAETPFCFWFGSYDPHRAYDPNTGMQSGLDIDQVIVPEFMPDVPCVRNDILDYYYEVERFDRECGEIIALLEEKGMLDNTLIVMTSDNGMPFPRAKANLYDYGTRMPLAVRWPKKVKAGQEIEEFVSFVDFAPSFLEAAGITAPESMSGKSIWPLLKAKKNAEAYANVFIERERHANVRAGDLSYPMRAIRDKEYLFIRNVLPERWPAGDPQVHQAVGQYGDVDNSISKFLTEVRDGETEAIPYFKLSFDKRPEEELYDIVKDPYQLNNLAIEPEYANVLAKYRAQLLNWMEESNDPRFENPETIYWDTVEYVPNYSNQQYDLEQKIANYIMLTVNGDSLNCQ